MWFWITTVFKSKKIIEVEMQWDIKTIRFITTPMFECFF